MILSSKLVTTVRDPRKARVQSPDMQRCGEEGGAGGAGGGRGEIKIKIEARDASQSSAVHLSALTPQASKTSGAPNSTITAACPWPGS